MRHQSALFATTAISSVGSFSSALKRPGYIPPFFQPGHFSQRGITEVAIVNDPDILLYRNGDEEKGRKIKTSPQPASRRGEGGHHEGSVSVPVGARGGGVLGGWAPFSVIDGKCTCARTYAHTHAHARLFWVRQGQRCGRRAAQPTQATAQVHTPPASTIKERTPPAEVRTTPAETMKVRNGVCNAHVHHAQRWNNWAPRTRQRGEAGVGRPGQHVEGWSTWASCTR